VPPASRTAFTAAAPAASTVRYGWNISFSWVASSHSNENRPTFCTNIQEFHVSWVLTLPKGAALFYPRPAPDADLLSRAYSEQRQPLGVRLENDFFRKGSCRILRSEHLCLSGMEYRLHQIYHQCDRYSRGRRLWMGNRHCLCRFGQRRFGCKSVGCRYGVLGLQVVSSAREVLLSPQTAQHSTFEDIFVNIFYLKILLSIACLLCLRRTFFFVDTFVIALLNSHPRDTQKVLQAIYLFLN
jgi:hypothetical protein